MGDLISKKTRRRFEEYYSGVVVRDIQADFDDHDIAQVKTEYSESATGVRRGLVREYYGSIDWTSPSDVRKVLGVYFDVVERLRQEIEDVDAFGYEADRAPRTKILRDRLIAAVEGDGYQLTTTGFVDRNNVGTEAIQRHASLLEGSTYAEQVKRLRSSVEEDPALAVGTAKELLETTTKTILTELGISFEVGEPLPTLVTKVRKELRLLPSDVPNATKGEAAVKALLGSLGKIASSMAELRNLYGSGHGRTTSGAVKPRHARLAVGSAITLCTFLLDTYREQHMSNRSV